MNNLKLCKTYSKVFNDLIQIELIKNGLGLVHQFIKYTL